MKEKVLWGTHKDNPDGMEEIITTKEEEFEEAKKWAKNNGYNRFRIAEINLNEPPNFKNTIQ